LTTGYLYNVTPTTSGSATNAHWALASGSIYFLQRDTSSARYKKDIKTWVPDWDLFDLRFTSFIGSSGIPLHDGTGEPLRTATGAMRYEREWATYRSFGLVAEEASSVHPSLVTVDADGDPDGIVWSVVTARIVEELRTLKDRIAVLEAA
jgi:hypothetical protein